MANDPHENPHNRRAMFRLGLQRLMDPLAGYLQERFDLRPPTPRTVLRPPGARPEDDFLERCYRCGNCVDACPAHAILAITPDDPEQAGTPYIDPDLAACVVCDELACMKVCPSGALQMVEHPRDIAMGQARVNLTLCLRGQAQDCTICVDKCPIGPTALAVNDAGHIEVHTAGCVGCGTCQFYCPNQPKAIAVTPDP